jgi:hypothetical protein
MAKSEDPRDLKSERRAWRRETAAAASLGGEFRLDQQQRSSRGRVGPAGPRDQGAGSRDSITGEFYMGVLRSLLSLLQKESKLHTINNTFK